MKKIICLVDLTIPGATDDGSLEYNWVQFCKRACSLFKYVFVLLRLTRV